jgi:hypothetical protein
MILETRYKERKRWFRPSQLILQVKEQTVEYVNYNYCIKSETGFRWRDATVSDLKILEVK